MGRVIRRAGGDPSRREGLEREGEVRDEHYNLDEQDGGYHADLHIPDDALELVEQMLKTLRSGGELGIQEVIPDLLDEERVRQIMIRYAGRLVAVAWRFVRDIHEAADIVQFAWGQLFSGYPDDTRLRHLIEADPAGGRELYTWLLTVVRNAARNYLRQRGKLLSLRPEDWSGCHHEQFEGIESYLVRAECYATLSKMIGNLPPRYRRAILHMRDGLTLQAVSTKLKIPLNTAKSDRKRALGLLRKACEAKGIGLGDFVGRGSEPGNPYVATTFLIDTFREPFLSS